LNYSYLSVGTIIAIYIFNCVANQYDAPFGDIEQMGYEMSQAEVERFLGRLITDADFRARAAASLKSACSKERVSVSPEEMTFLSYIDFVKFGPVSDSIDDSIRRKQGKTDD
jgi:hypothetical protein